MKAKSDFYSAGELLIRVKLALLLLAKQNGVFLIGQREKYKLGKVTLVVVNRG